MKETLAAVAASAMLVFGTQAAASAQVVAGPIGSAPALAPGVAALVPVAQPDRPGDIWTGGGLLFAPRYLAQGGLEVGLGGMSLLAGPANVPPNSFSPVAGVRVAPQDGVELAALLGPVTLAGVRARISQSIWGSTGIAMLYRSDVYATSAAEQAQRPELVPPFFGLVAAPGFRASQGVEFRVDLMQNLANMHFYAVPSLRMMAHGTRVGLGVGSDLDLGQLVLGWNYNGGLAVASPVGSNQNALESQWGLGGRLVLGPQAYVTGTYIFVPGDAYGQRSQAVMAGIGFTPSMGAASYAAPVFAPASPMAPSGPAPAEPSGGLIRRSR
ncbi:MAG: hypothetical protein VKP57_12825 [Candidatus Sericytochromatia bacterium]|nr:hypothetical protein [Candidatus Sericytochromatia bacterium]